MDLVFLEICKVIRRKKHDNSDKSVTEVDAEYGIKKKIAFLNLLFEMKQDKVSTFETDQDILDEVATFIFAGHDTMTMALTFTTWLLGTHLDVQEQLYHEVSSVIQGIEETSMEDYNKMAYLDRVIKESLRLYPPVPIVGREATEDVILPSNGYTVPRGAQIQMFIYTLHRREDIFPDADKFNPDRFLEEQINPYSYIPFSAGLRNCIGQKFAIMEMKVIISNLVLQYKIKSVGEVVPSPNLLLRCQNGPYISLTSRD